MKRMHLYVGCTALALLAAVGTAEGQVGLQFNGSTQYVSMGAAPGLRASPAFTIECWFKRTATGVGTSTGTGGIASLVPLVAKGAAESETAGLNANYILGIDTSTNTIGVDFEEAAGPNHPLTVPTSPASNVIALNTWYHVAATYDGTNWRIYLNGSLVHSAVVGATPEPNSAQAFGIGTTITSGSASPTPFLAAGFFAGVIDEVRVWNAARTAGEISANMNLPIATASNLIGRWSFNEGATNEVFDTSTAGAAQEMGTLAAFAAGQWVTGAPALQTAGERIVAFQQGVNGYTSSLDTTLTQAPATAGTPQNGVATLTVDAETTPSSTNDAQQTLIRFDNIFGAGAGQIPSGATLQSASMTINVSNATANPPNIHRMVANFTAAATWNSFVGGVQADGTEARTTADYAPANLSTIAVHNVDLTNSVQAWYGGSPNEGWAWLPSGTDGLVFDSADGATASLRPRLVVSYYAPANAPPNQPTVVTPANGATGVGTSPTLTVNVTDPESNPMTVTLFGRANTIPPPGPDFTIIALPDTQFYACGTPCSSSNSILNTQLQWIVDNKASRNIAFVTQLGDCVEHGNDGNVNGANAEWDAANTAYQLIENPLTTMLTYGIPYGIAVGNHDQTPINVARSGGDEGATTVRYNNTFGVSRFLGRSYYGGRYDFGAPATYPNNNDNHYELFSVSGLDFIIIHLEYDDAANATRTAALNWANGLLQTYSSRRAIITSHYIINPDGTFGNQGQAIYDALKGNPNLFLMLCGHLDQANRRSDTFGGNTVNTLLSDYQTRPNGGDGWMRRLIFSPANNTIHVETFSPWANYPNLPKQEQLINTHADNAGTALNDFTLSYAMSSSPPAFAQIGSPQTGVASGSNASVVWSGLADNTTYQWYTTVSDGTSTTTGATWSFQTQCTGNAACDDGNPCTTDVCDNGACTHTNNTNSCNDGNNCTTGDVCSGGVCAGTPTSCLPGTTCNPTNGLCEAQPVTVSFQQGTAGYSGEVDTYIDAGAPTANNGAAVALVVDLAPNVKQALLRFGNLFASEGGPIPAGATITSATLTVNVATSAGTAQQIGFHRMKAAWVPSNTWNDFGASPWNATAGIQLDNVEANTAADASTTIPDGVNVITVTSSVQAWYANPASNFGWVLNETVDDSVTFDSAEGATVASRPKLTVTYLPPPPCQVNGDCNDGNACTTDTCNNGTCVYTPITCNDSNACTTDTCNPASGCVYTPITCNDNDGCTSDSCNPASGCVHTPVDCADTDPCTVDSCQPANTAAVSLGGSSQYVSLGTGAAVTNFGSGSFTVEGWVRAVSVPTDSTTIFRLGRQGSNAQAVVQLRTSPANSIQASVETSVSPTQVDTVASAITLNTWTHFAMVADRTTGAQRLKLYVNGSVVSDVDASLWGTNAVTAPAGDASLLGVARSDTNTLINFLNGSIDEVRIWSMARTQSEIQNNMNVQLLSGTGLVARWALNEGSGTSATDSVGSNTGTLTGGATWVTGAANLVNMGSGGCVHTPIANCCTSAAQCDDSNACTTDTCDSGQCVHTAITCDDGSACTTDTCSPASGCVFTPISCNDNNGCTTDSCNPASGCVFTPADCNDNNPCTTDSCQPANLAALSFDGIDDYVTMGAATATLGAQSFTVECWFKWGGGGAATSTGTGGVTAYPLVTKGRSEADGTTQDCNYFLGIATNKLAADFEDNATGGNHPITGTATITTGVWHHAAVTFDVASKTWVLYLDGVQDATSVLASTFTPRFDSIQHFAIGSALNSVGSPAASPAGYFQGQIDEVRVWNLARTQAEVQATMNQQVTSGTGLLGRYGLNEGTGTTTTGSAGPSGTLTNGPSWITTGLVDFGGSGCTHTPIANCCSSDAQCNDSNACTTDTCSNGTCVNTPISCNDNDACTTDTCNPASGCVHTPLDCNDGDSCTVDTCVGGSCQHVVNCDDGNPCTVDSCAPGNTWALSFDGVDDHVFFGAASTHTELGLLHFTVECWFKKSAAGSTTAISGTVNAVPLVSKGRGVGDGSNIDLNYFLGIRNDTGVLVGDFESVEAPGGDNNHTISGTTVLATGTWYHAAIAYDGATFTLYLNGNVEGTRSTTDTPRSDSILPFGLATAFDQTTPTPVAQGFFAGQLDEVRVWDNGRTQSQIQGAMNTQIASAPGLVGRWGLNDGTGTTASDSSGNANTGTLTNGPVWTNTGLPNLGGGCTHTPVANGTGCSDGNLCNGSETCQAGICTSGTPLDCNDNNPCTTDSCDSQAGCQHTNNSNSCDDGNACTTGDTCSGGSCVGTPMSCDDGNPCTTDTCNNGVCQHSNNSASCNDGDACTTNDTCSGGACVGTPIVCNDNNPCTTDSCVGGVCEYTNNNNSCDDGNACTTGDTCSGGVCAGTLISCDDNNPCTDDSCDNGQCVHTPNSNACNDGNACTNNDVCSNSVCAGTPIQGCCNTDSQCNDNNACTTDSCVNHTCQNVPNSDTCDDGNACTGGDVCANGVCAGTAIPGCCNSDGQCDDGNPCTTDSCVNHTCQHVNNTATCDDGNACTDNDVCAGGTCAGMTIAGCCNSNAECADSNPCTDDACVNHACVHQNNSATCDDGNACTGNDTCNNGTCAGAPIDCDDGNPCTDDSCVAGNCVHTPNTASCNDGNACTQNDVCSGGTCAGTPIDCNDNNPCTDDSCVNGTCHHDNNAASCDDGNPCTTNDTCSGGACAGQAVANCCTADAQCNDNNSCTNDTCENNQCVYTPNTNACDDGNACTTGDTCSGGSCSGTPMSCDDGNPCTNDTCNNGVCEHTNNNNGCNDGNACTTNDTCSGGVCAGTPIVCNDNNPCTSDACVGGVCEYTNNSNSCDDGNACTTNDTCSGGACAGTPIVCNDNNPCTDDSCVNGQCVFTPNTHGCNDGNACTTNDTCSGGVCAGTPIVCNDNNPCTTDSCNPLSGCQYVNVANGTSCSDGQFCNGAETCQGGTCTGGTAPCIDQLHCNEAGDTCYECVSAAECNDNDPCTADSCTGGSCVHTPLNCISVTLHVDGLGFAVTRSVTFVLTPCGGAPETRILPIAFTPSGAGYGVGSVVLSNVNPNTAWLSAREGHTLQRRLPVSFPSSLLASVSFTGTSKLLAGDLQTAGSNQDNLVDVIDFAILASRWNTVVAECGSGLPAECSRGADVNGDGQQGTIDFTALQINFFKAGDTSDGCPSGLEAKRPIGIDGPLQAGYLARVRVAQIANRVPNAARADQNGDGMIDATDIRLFATRNRLALLPGFDRMLGAATPAAGEP